MDLIQISGFSLRNALSASVGRDSGDKHHDRQRDMISIPSGLDSHFDQAADREFEGEAALVRILRTYWGCVGGLILLPLAVPCF
ncbi:hypothetical protein ABMA59_24055 [Mesorhizobium sp. CN2-181]